MKEARFTFKIEQKDKERIDAVAKLYKISASSIARDATMKSVEKMEKASR